MRGGSYRNRVYIQTQGFSIDTDGGLLRQSPATYAGRWARVRSPKGTESELYAQLGSEITHVVELRQYTSGIDETMIVRWDARTFDINAVLHDELRHKYTNLYCTEHKRGS